MKPPSDLSPGIAETLLADDDATTAGGPESYCPTCDRSFTTDSERCPIDGTTLARLQGQQDLRGQVIDGRFTIQERLGEGGMGTVYRGLQHSIGRAVAIKVIHPHLAKNTQVVKRFLREAKLTSRFSHPNTITVLDSGQTESGLLYMVMELLEGQDLEGLLRKRPTLSIQRSIAIASQLCDALSAAHEQDVIHRDLKPANIFLLNNSSDRDIVKVLDFGLAKSFEEGETALTHSNMLLGTPRYLPPEVALGQPASSSSDLYSLGVILYEMVSGRSPFQVDTVNALIYQQAHGVPEPLPSHVPRPLRAIIEQLLAKDPADRVESAQALRGLLQTCMPAHHGASGDGAMATAATLHAGAEIAPALVDAGSGPASRRRVWLVAIPTVALAAAAASALSMIGTNPRENANRTPGPQPAAALRNAGAASVTDAAPASRAAVSEVGSDAGTKIVAEDSVASVLVRFRSFPPGATVSVAGHEQCTTPCSIEIPLEDLPVQAVFSKSGHRRQQRSVESANEDLVEVKLKRRGRRPHRPSSGGEDFMTD